MPDKSVSQIETIISAAILEADALIRSRLSDAGIRIPHTIVAIDENGSAYVRGTSGPHMLREMAAVLLDVAKEHSMPPTKERH